MGAELEPVKPVSAVEFYADERESFDRLDGESQLEHGWFSAYCRLGRKRSYKEVALQQEVSRELIQRTASKHSWRLRCEAYDDFVDARRLAEIESRQIEVRSEHAELFKDARAKLTAAISLVDPYKMNPRDMPAWLEVITKGERQAVGITDAPKRIEITGKDGGDIKVSDMSAGERQDKLAEIMSEIARRMSQVEALNAPEILDGDVVEDALGQTGQDG